MPDNVSRSTDDFTAFLEAYDAALAAGTSLPGTAPPPAAPGSLGHDRSSEVQRVQRAKACLDLLEKVWPRSDAPTMMGPPPDDDLDGCDLELAMPPRFGRFEIRRLIGRGGFAVVYLAYDPERGGEVALKIPRPDVLVSADLRMRFFREAHALAALEHPNIVSSYEVGEIGPACYLTSAYCEGPTLEQWICLRNQPVDERVAAGLVEMLANAMQHAHQRGVLHRDIKPGNIILEQGIPRLTDFGLAKIAELRGEDTKTGAVLGTPKYMAPEQARSRNRDIGPRTDVYSLGTILYELLTGNPPFDGTSDFDILFKVLWTDPIPVSRHRPGVSKDLGAICQKCLEKQPEARYESAEALASDLRRFLAGQRTTARPEGLVRRGVRWARKSKARTGLVLVSAAFLLLLGAGITTHTIRMERLLIEAERSRVEARQRAREVAESNRTLRRHLYASSMRQAREAIQNGETKRVLYYLNSFAWDEDFEDLRGFEWHYLMSLCNRQRLSLHGHQGAVFTVAYSTDGRVILSAGADGTVREWDRDGGSLLATYPGHQGDINAVIPFPDNLRFASAGDDQTIRIYNRQSGTCEQVITTGSTGNLYALDVSRDMSTLVAGGVSGQIILLETQSGRELASWYGGTGPIDGLSFTPDGKTIVCGGRDGIRIWDVAKQHEIQTLAGLRAPVTELDVDRSGKLLAASGWDSVIQLWDLATGVQKVTFPNHFQCTEDVVFDPEGERLATCGMDDAVRIWDVASGELYLELQGHAGKVSSLCFAPDREEIASAGADGTVRVWNLQRSIDPAILTAGATDIDHLALSPDSRTVATASGTGSIQLWNLLEKNGPTEIGTHRREVRSIAFTATGALVASCCHGDTITLWDLSSKGAQPRVLVRDLPSASMEFSSDGESLLVGGATGKLQVLDTVSGQVELDLKVGDGPTQATFSTDERSILVGRTNGTLEIWDRATARRLSQTKAHRDAVHAVSYSHDGKYVASAGDDRIVCLAPSHDLSEVRILEGHHGAVKSIAFAPDSRTLASAAQDGSVLLWNVATGRLVAELEPPLRSATAVAFSADGQKLVAAGALKGGEQDALVLWEIQHSPARTSPPASQASAPALAPR